MDFRDRDQLSSVFHFPVGLTIESMHPSVHELIIHMACCQPTMACPECHQPSARIHGRYRRTVADLPCAGRNVILALTRQGKLPTGFISCAALSDALEQVLARCRAEIRQRQQERFPEHPASPARSLPHPKTWKQQHPQHMERTYQAHRSEREDRFRHIMELRAEAPLLL